MRLAMVAAGAVLFAMPAAAQIPVSDAGSYVNQIKSLAQEVKSYALQAKDYVVQGQQLAQQVQTYYSFVQNPSLGAALGVMDRAGLTNDLPINPHGLMGLTTGYSMSLSGISSKLSALGSLANTAYSDAHVYDCATDTWACQAQRQRAYGIAGSRGIAQTAYANLRDHMPVLQALRDRAATATTPAERDQVMLALQNETAWNNNLAAQLHAANMEMEMQTASLRQRDDERLSQDLRTTIDQLPD